MLNKLEFRKGFLRRNYSAGNARSPRFRKRRIPLPVGLFEFQPEYILGVRISRPFRKVARVAIADLEDGVISPSPGRANILDPEQVSRRVVALAKALGSTKGPFGLLLPDASARVSMLDFETLPADHKEQESLIRWKMKPFLPFPLEEARLSFAVKSKEPSGVEAVVVALRKSVIAEYESMMDALNGDVRLVLPASAALLSLLSEDRADGELLLNVSPTMMTAIVVSGQYIRMWRSQSMQGKSAEQRLAAVSEEAARTLAAAHDHLGLEVNDVHLCVRPTVPEGWAEELGRTLVRAVATMVPDPSAVGIRLSSEERQLLRDYGATAAGIVANAT